MKKGQVYEGIVERVDFPNKGVVRAGEDIVIVKNALPGQKIKLSVNKVRKGKAEGRLLEVTEQSPLETGSPCSHFGVCGGCTYLSLPYQEQLRIKETQVKKLLDGVLCRQEQDWLWEGIKGSPRAYEYRNKMEFSFGDEYKDGPLALGMHKRGSFHDVVNVEDCAIVDADYRLILRKVREFFTARKVCYFHRLRHEGYLRHLLVRKASGTGEILVALVTTSQSPWQETACGQAQDMTGREEICTSCLGDVTEREEICMSCLGDGTEREEISMSCLGDGTEREEISMSCLGDGTEREEISMSCLGDVTERKEICMSCAEEKGRSARNGNDRKAVGHTENGSDMAGNVGNDSDAAGSETELMEGFRRLLLSLEEEGRLQGRFAGILHIVNDSLSDVLQSDRTDVLYGKEYFYEDLLGLRFRISTFSFFQTNSYSAQVLYETAREYIGEPGSGCADGRPDKTVFDLYSGTGTIAQMMAPSAGKVVGVEIVEEAVEAARRNALENGISNCEFVAGDVLKVLDELEEKPDLIILDPPRDGIHPKALPKIISYGVERILYISCKPTSLVRDLEVFLQEGYVVEKAVAVDQFPWTANVETICCLSRIK